MLLINNILAIIPARGGSKGLPGKNIMNIGGKPVISYSILHAIKSKLINRVIVTTDDQKIADVALEYGAEVPFLRPAEFAQDLSPDIDAFRHTLLWLQDNENYIPDLIVHLRPTGPVRRVELIDEAIEKMMSNQEADALRSVSPAMQTPYKMWQINDDGKLEPVLRIDGIPDCQSIGRQSLPMTYWQNGYVDVIRPRAILEKNSMWGDHAIPFVINETLLELDYAENIPDIEEALLKLEKGEYSSPESKGHHPV